MNRVSTKKGAAYNLHFARSFRLIGLVISRLLVSVLSCIRSFDTCPQEVFVADDTLNICL